MRPGDDDLGPDERERGPREPPPPERQGIGARHVLIGLLAIVLIAFAIANFERVDVNFLVFETQARVVTVIVVAAILGFIAGYFVERPSREERKRLRPPKES